MKRRDNIDRMKDLMEEMRKGEPKPKSEPKAVEPPSSDEEAEDKPKRKKKVVEQE